MKIVTVLKGIIGIFALLGLLTFASLSLRAVSHLPELKALNPTHLLDRAGELDWDSEIALELESDDLVETVPAIGLIGTGAYLWRRGRKNEKGDVVKGEAVEKQPDIRIHEDDLA